MKSEEKALKERFISKGYSVTGYARVKGLQRSTLSRVLLGELDGKNNRKESHVRKIIKQLKEDGVWIEALPWEVKQSA